MLKNGAVLAEARLREEAVKLNADGVYGVSIVAPQVTAGAAELIMYEIAYKNV